MNLVSDMIEYGYNKYEFANGFFTHHPSYQHFPSGTRSYSFEAPSSKGHDSILRATHVNESDVQCLHISTRTRLSLDLKSLTWYFHPTERDRYEPHSMLV